MTAPVTAFVVVVVNSKRERLVGVREQLNERRALTGAVAGMVILGALAVALRTGCSGGAGGASGPSKHFFSVDDGQTWFADDASKIPPFEHEGKPAYRAKVFRCPDGTEFTSHLERFGETDKKRLEALVERMSDGPALAMQQAAFTHLAEVKKPGDKEWIQWNPQNTEQYERILKPICPDGSTHNVEPVLP